MKKLFHPPGIFGCISILVFMLAGCAVNQEKEVATYRDVLGSGPQGFPESLEPNQPLCLSDALHLANQHNEQLAVKGEEYLQALINKDRATANFLPKVTFIPTYTRQQKANFPPALSGLAEQFVPAEATDMSLTAQINLNIPLDIANLKRTKATAQQQRSLLLDLKDSLLLDVTEVYYQIMISELQSHVLEYSIFVQNERVRNTRNKYSTGTSKSLDVLQAETLLSQTKIKLLKVKNDISNGRSMLAFLTGQNKVTEVLIDEMDLPEELPSKEQFLAIAWRYRNDLSAAQHQLEAASHLLQQAWSQYFPSVGLDFTYFLSRESFPSDVHWIGILQVSLPIFNAGLIHADVRTAWSKLRQAKLVQVYLMRQIDEQLTIALENISEVSKRMNELQVQLETARQAVKQANESYNTGLSINLDRLAAQEQLLTAQLELADAQFTKKIDYFELLRVVGRFSEESLQEGFEPCPDH
jgi:outer membrane protein TolC